MRGDRKGGSQEEFTVGQIRGALEAAMGLVTVAAAKLGCHRNTVHGYIRRHPELRTVKMEQREKFKDAVEAAIIQAVTDEKNKTISKEERWKMIRWVGDRLLHDRGYEKRQQVTGPGGGPIDLGARVVVLPDNKRGDRDVEPE